MDSQDESRPHRMPARRRTQRYGAMQPTTVEFGFASANYNSLATSKTPKPHKHPQTLHIHKHTSCTPYQIILTHYKHSRYTYTNHHILTPQCSRTQQQYYNTHNTYILNLSLNTTHLSHSTSLSLLQQFI